MTSIAFYLCIVINISVLRYGGTIQSYRYYKNLGHAKSVIYYLIWKMFAYDLRAVSMMFQPHLNEINEIWEKFVFIRTWTEFRGTILGYVIVPISSRLIFNWHHTTFALLSNQYKYRGTKNNLLNMASAQLD